VSCYRVYDSDLPDYAVAIDLFRLEGTRPRPAALVSEYAAPREVDPTLARARLLDVLAVVPGILGCKPADVHVRIRSRSRGGSQYADAGSGARPAPERIEEGGLAFEVDLSRRIDCGIFLDDRETRAIIREMAKPRDGRALSFLNLFAYTGTATCYAADGGAASTTTVDLSQTYLDWARRNMAANGFTGPEHVFVRADVLRWVLDQRRGRRRWDLVFCEPPTFSNSSAMGRRSFDVQRDHVELLIDVSRLLAPGGVAVFSCNLRSFSPDLDALARAHVSVEDITARTIPEDFARTPKVHHCYLISSATSTPDTQPSSL
jgi:23S rRNA (guanine2445-N2)-methyltransferase / 23S rRNA (guanine2069-N7)-methyltransferase